MAENAEESPVSGLNPKAMTVADAARLLSRASGQSITQVMLQTDIAAGAPMNPDGTLNLVHFAAWQVKEVGRGE